HRPDAHTRSSRAPLSHAPATLSPAAARPNHARSPPANASEEWIRGPRQLEAQVQPFSIETQPRREYMTRSHASMVAIPTVFPPRQAQTERRPRQTEPR